MAGVREKKDPRPVVGIMGGICSGKSVVADIFVKHGFHRIDADAIVHSLFAVEPIREALRSSFGEAVFTVEGALDKPALADLVFEDSEKLSELNSIILPEVVDIIAKRVSERPDPTVLDAPLLVETGLDKRFCTDLMFVERSLQERIELAGRKRGWDEKELLRREDAQAPLGLKKQKADIVIPNHGSIRELEGVVTEIIKERFHRCLS